MHFALGAICALTGCVQSILSDWCVWTQIFIPDVAWDLKEPKLTKKRKRIVSDRETTEPRPRPKQTKLKPVGSRKPGVAISQVDLAETLPAVRPADLLTKTKRRRSHPNERECYTLNITGRTFGYGQGRKASETRHPVLGWHTETGQTTLSGLDSGRPTLQRMIPGQVLARAGKAPVLPQRKTILVVITQTSNRKEMGMQVVASLDHRKGAGFIPEARRPEE